MARLMQVGECLHNHTIGLHEPLCAFRFCSPAPAPHAKPRHGNASSTFLGLDFPIAELRPPVASALHQSAATEQLGSERCQHLSQMTDRPSGGRAQVVVWIAVADVTRQPFKAGVQAQQNCEIA
jgi:hypothetical protein